MEMVLGFDFLCFFVFLRFVSAFDGALLFYGCFDRFLGLVIFSFVNNVFLDSERIQPPLT